MGTTKIKLLISVFAILGFMQSGCAQTENEKINSDETDRKEVIEDHYKKSNILDPDTLKGDQKRIFDHFASWTLKEVEDIESLVLKSEFEKIGIITKENNRFLDAYGFFKNRVVFHKISRENCKYFEDRYGKIK